MKYKYIYSIICCLCLAQSGNNLIANDQNEAIKIYEKIISGRNGIKSLRFRLTLKQNTGTDTNLYSYTIWIDGDKIRYDQTDIESTRNGFRPDVRNFVCKNCENYYMFRGSLGKNLKTPVHFYSKADRRITTGHEIEWRHLGTYPSDFGSLYLLPNFKGAEQYNVIFNNPKNYPITVNREDGGVTAIEIVYDKMLGTKKTVYINETRSVPTRTTFVGRNGYSEHIDLSYDPMRIDNFPRRIQYRRVSGNTVHTEDIHISDVEINGSIDPKVFTLAGCDLADGTPLFLPDMKNPSDAPVWRNGKIDYDYTLGKMSAEGHQKLQANTAKPDTPPPSFWARSWPYLVGAAVFAALGFFLLRKMRKPAD